MKQTRPTARPPLVRLVGWQAGEDAPAIDTTTPTIGHRLAHGIVSATAFAATGLLGPAALAAPGDLDPSFADVGRRSDLNLDGPLWSLDVQDNDAILFAGTAEYCYWGCDLYDFTGRLLPNGTTDAGFAAAALDGTAVYDTALQGDGKVVGVGSLGTRLQVYRMLPNGSLDAGFGVGGRVIVSATTGSSVIVEPDGRIVVAGRLGSELLVARLLADGVLDPAFGTGGVYVGSTTGNVDSSSSHPARVVRAPGGGYRVMANLGADCAVVGLTQAGALDAGFGNAGVAVVARANSNPVTCNSMAIDATGRLLVGGKSPGAGGSNGHVARLLANGTQDPGFSAAPISAQFSEVTALTVGPTGSIFVAGRERTGFAGATVVRMLADGALDPLYGRAGLSRIELKAARSGDQIPGQFGHPVINDMRALGNDVLVVGGNSGQDYLGAPFVARLLGNAAGGSPGVLSMQQDRFLGTEQAGKATISVRRIGGTKGAIAASYSARDLAARELAGRAPASKGQDYTAIAGRLTWADGDDSDREIVVPIASDTLAEPPEFFELVLDTPEGGAGLGAYGTEIEIAGEGYPAGLLTIRPVQNLVAESGQADFQVDRESYSAGIVTVTVRVAGGSATPGQDFASPGESTAWRDVVITFQNNETQKLVPVPVLRDGKTEGAETFTLELLSPTGGAALGAQKQATVTILDGGGNSSGGTGGGGGGGGALGWFATLLLGLAGGLRRLLARDRRLQPSA